jgi:uncharacterized protein GlcG (DUF336 family)
MRRQISAKIILANPVFRAAMAMLALACAAPGSCGGSSSSSSSSSGSGSSSGPAENLAASTTPGILGDFLTAADVSTIVLQAVHEATARGAPATIAVIDRVGNPLMVTQMPGAPPMATVASGLGNNTGLEGVSVPSTAAALAKAYTGAYLSSNGNAFSTRTANQIVQQHFDPGVLDTPAGPLFGVQFSQLPCSDFNTAPSTTPGGTNAGPHFSPLGFSADSGGLPLYKNGVLVGGIGVMTKTVYSDNLNIFAVPIDNDEVIALAGSTGYVAPSTITADNIAVGGLTLQYTDATPANFAASVAASGVFTPDPVPGLFAGPATGQTAIAGLTYASPDGGSGIAPDGALGPPLYPGTTTVSAVFTDGNGHILYAPTNGLVPTGGLAITAAEAQALMTSTLNVAYSARAAIRIPTNSFAQVTATIVDLDGNVLAQARTPDAPIFGADVSRQKARSAVFFSRTDAAAKINAITETASTVPGTFADYITRSQQLVEPTVFSDGIAWSEVAIGDIARPFYPDGIDGSGPGSLSLPIALWSIFSTGLQVDLIKDDLANLLTGKPQSPLGCANSNGKGLPAVSGGKTQLADGLQIFSGGFPIYRGSTLVGAIGISGDGIQQDSMISFLGLQNFSEPTAGLVPLSNAPAAIRADTLAPEGIQLRYVNCPASPFLNSNVQNPC